jgi:hypothetical protein
LAIRRVNKGRIILGNAVRTLFAEKIKLDSAGLGSPLVGQVDDFALVCAIYGAVVSVYEVCYIA